MFCQKLEEILINLGLMQKPLLFICECDTLHGPTAIGTDLDLLHIVDGIADGIAELH
jgi:hypothetical protein